MASRKDLVICHLTSCFSAAIALASMIHGVFLAWKINEVRNNSLISPFLFRNRNYLYKNFKRQRQRNKKRRSRWHEPGRTGLWWRNMLTGVFPEESWKRNFRMSRRSFNSLLEELAPYCSPNPSSPNHRALTSATKLALTLYFLKDTGTLRITANTFGVAVSTASAVIVDVSQALNKYLGPKYIHLPEDTDSMRKWVSEF